MRSTTILEVMGKSTNDTFWAVKKLPNRFPRMVFLLVFGLICGCHKKEVSRTTSSVDPSQRQVLMASSAGTAAPVNGEKTVWISKPDGAKSCSPESGESLDQGSDELRTAKIEILESKKGSDGMLNIQMCGANQGSTNTYRIRESNLEAAKKLGFKEAGI